LKERRKAAAPERLATPYPEGTPQPGGSNDSASNQLRDPRTGLYTMAAIYEFIRYEIDGGSQTELNERFVTPVCAVAIGLDLLPSLPNDAERAKLVEVTGEALRRITRKADRLARHDNDFVALLRRTLSGRAREFYAPHVSAAIGEATREAGSPTTLSFGISSLTEHLVRDPHDMVRKALAALEVARQSGPAGVKVYDLREMGLVT
jgi:GGDEF domain-containing protein